jgi:thiol-disulfide isomerase/thioredoxin
VQPERLVVLAIVVAVVSVAVVFVKLDVRTRAGRLAGSPWRPLWDALGTQPDGRATVVAFSSRSCGACHSAQLPALGALEDQLGATVVRLLEVDVAAQPEVARRFGIMTVPSTVVLRADGAVGAINHGFTPTARLATQLSSWKQRPS